MHYHACSYVEAIGNPAFVVPNFDSLREIATKNGVAIIADNTFGAAGYIAQPLKLGANIIVASATKFIGGHGALTITLSAPTHRLLRHDRCWCYC